jgi:GNAT superfamily N-acetyltransferase
MQTPMQITCREAAPGDLPEVLRLYAQPELDDGVVLALPEAERLYARFARYPDYKLYVALSGGTIVGTFALLIMDNLGHLGAPSGVIEDVAVDPGCWRRGVGGAMMRHALGICRSKGCYKAALSSNVLRKDAHRFYESLGFEVHGYSFNTSSVEATRA